MRYLRGSGHSTWWLTGCSGQAEVCGEYSESVDFVSIKCWRKKRHSGKGLERDPRDKKPVKIHLIEAQAGEYKKGNVNNSIKECQLLVGASVIEGPPDSPWTPCLLSWRLGDPSYLCVLW